MAKHLPNRWAVSRLLVLALTALLLVAVACDQGSSVSNPIYVPPSGGRPVNTVPVVGQSTPIRIVDLQPTAAGTLDLAAPTPPLAQAGVEAAELRFEPTGDYYTAGPLKVLVRLAGEHSSDILSASLSVYDEQGKPALYGGEPLNPYAMFPSMEPGWWQAQLSTPSQAGRYYFVLDTMNYQKQQQHFVLLAKPLAVAEDPSPLSSGLIIARNSNIWLTTLDGKRQRKLTFYPELRSWAKDPVWSPDGKQIVYTYAAEPRDPMADQLSELWIMNADGSGKQQLAAHVADENLEAAQWSPDSKQIYYHAMKWQYDAQGNFTGQKWDVRRLDLASGKSVSLIANAQLPRLDGQHLFYVETLPEDEGMAATVAALPTRPGNVPTTPIPTTTQRLMIADLDGKNAKQVLGSEFIAIYAPAVAPGGQRVVFAAIGGPQTPPQASLWDGIVGFFGPTAASAHGLPWDLWIVNSDGSGLRRLTSLNEDMPYPVWSKDGTRLIFVGATGLYQLDPATAALTQFQKYENGSHTELSWHE